MYNRVVPGTGLDPYGEVSVFRIDNGEPNCPARLFASPYDKVFTATGPALPSRVFGGSGGVAAGKTLWEACSVQTSICSPTWPTLCAMPAGA